MIKIFYQSNRQTRGDFEAEVNEYLQQSDPDTDNIIVAAGIDDAHMWIVADVPGNPTPAGPAAAVGGALAMAGGNALGLMRMEERVKELEEWHQTHLANHEAATKIFNSSWDKQEQHTQRLDEHDKNFKRIVTDIERLVDMVKEHIKKGFWG
jgi:hypothetical protein